MTYVLGSAANTDAPARMQHTCDGDDFFSLGRAYGVDPKVIMNLQPALAGKVITKTLVQNFVKSLPGWSRDKGIRPFVASDNPGTVDPNGKPEGYAIFTSHTQLMLPDMPRLDGKVPLTDPSVIIGPPTVIKSKATPKKDFTPLWVAGGLAVLLVAAVSKKKKERRALAAT